MRVEAHAFLSDALFAASEDELWRQLAVRASYPGIVGADAMPDVHVGFGLRVGCVLVTEDTLIRAGSGYAISCGVIHLKARAEAEAGRRNDRGTIDAEVLPTGDVAWTIVRPGLGRSRP